jgi:N-acetylneuraminic acid mutarotase
MVVHLVRIGGMNLPSLSRAALAVGVLSALFVLSARGANPAPTPTPPDIRISSAHFSVGPTVSAAAAHLNNHIYYAGGQLPSKAVTNVVTDINLNNSAVSTLPSMPTPRAGLGLVGFLYTNSPNFGNVLVAIGGTNGTSALGTVEMYSFATGSWTEMAPMPTPRAYLAVVPGLDGKIYAIGGVDSNGDTLGTVEAFDPAKNTWSPVLSLNAPRAHLAAAVIFADAILVAGGVDDTGKVLNTTEVFNLAFPGAWSVWIPMLTARSDFGLSSAGDGYVHAIGGRSSTGGYLDSIEAYNVHTGVWAAEPFKLKSPNAGFATAEGLTGSIYVLGGAKGSTFYTRVTKARPPFAPTHDVTYFVHAYDEPYVNGTQVMDGQLPLAGFGLLQLGLLSSTNFSSFPSVGGTIQAGGSLTITIPSTIIVGLINGLTLTATNLDGSNPVVLGSASSLIGLSGTITFPVTSPLKLLNKVLVLNISTLVGVDLNLGGGFMYVTLHNISGKPSN